MLPMFLAEDDSNFYGIKVEGWPCCLLIVGLVVGFVFFLKSMVKQGVKEAHREMTAAPAGFRIDPDDSPGEFEIVGVDKETNLPRTWRVHAESYANAKAEAELVGIIVTRIERVE